MKKSVFAVVLLLAVCMATAAFADTRFGKKGTWTAGGGISYANATAESGGAEATVSSFDLAPGVGYFIIDGLAVGGSLGYNSTTTEVGDTSTDTSSMGISAMVHYYHLLQGTLFIGGGAHVGYFTQDEGMDLSGIGFGVQAGPTLAFGGKFGGYVSLLANYDSLTLKGDNDAEVKTSGFGVGTELGLFF